MGRDGKEKRGRGWGGSRVSKHMQLKVLQHNFGFVMLAKSPGEPSQSPHTFFNVFSKITVDHVLESCLH